MAPGYDAEIVPDDWVLDNNLEFPEFIKKTFRYNFKFNNGRCDLFTHQRIIKDFLQYESPYRGLVIYHGLGVGKTRSAIAAAESLSDKLDIVVMLPASIEQNFINEITKCGNKIFDTRGNWVSNGTSKKTKTWKRIEGTNNFEILDEESQSQIRKHVNNMVKNKYTFIHYNGMTKKSVLELGENFFDNKVVIIDEVHNFISRISNNSLIAKSLYKMMMKSLNTKIILLSGTPMINKPHEMAILTNLAKGYMVRFHVKFNVSNNANVDSEKLKKNVEFIDYLEIDNLKGTIIVIPTPYGFEKKSNNKIVRSKTNISYENILEIIKKNLKNDGIQVKSSEIVTSTILPENEEIFDNKFIDYEKKEIKNSNLLARRITGLVSYFEFYDPEQYPTLNETTFVKVKMSDEHFTKYMTLRQFEFEKESKAKKFKKNENKNNDLKTNNVYRSFSRAVCNYSFPTTIKRIYPSSFKQIQKEMDIVDDEDNVKEEGDIDDDSTSYKKQLELALNQLYENKDAFLKNDGLKAHGPKYYKIIKKIQASPGHVLIYSQFRNVEGLKIMEFVFKAHGYAELDIKKDKNNVWKLDIKKDDKLKPKYIVFTSDKEKNKILMDIFNSDFDLVPKELIEQMDVDYKEKNLHGKIIKALMITQSGAEGISLKNVRQVHIMEPYWNNIRVKQVIGRAVRANSHINLPKEERFVDVFMYLTEFNKDQLKDSVVISREKKMTSDEYVLDISKKKAKIIESIQDIMKSSSIDCIFNQDSSKCFKLPIGFQSLVKDSHIHLNNDISADIEDKQIKVKKNNKKIIKKISREIKFIINSRDIKIPYYADTNEALDPREYEKGSYKIIGRIEIINDKPRLVKI